MSQIDEQSRSMSAILDRVTLLAKKVGVEIADEEYDPGPDEAELAAQRGCCPVCGSCEPCDCHKSKCCPICGSCEPCKCKVECDPCDFCPPCPICGCCRPCKCRPTRGISFADVMQAMDDMNKATQ